MNWHIGIVGHEAAKFTPALEKRAKVEIRSIIETAIPGDPIIVSGACHLGGVDVWAEEIADAMGVPKRIFPPKTHSWADGYKPRNIQIAELSDVLFCLVVAELPATYTGMKFSSCYHCHKTDHVKSGGCWTAKYAERLGKQAIWHVIR